MKMLTSKYALAFYVGVILGLFGAAQQFIVEIAAQHPAEARIGGAFLIGVALFVEILPKPSQIINQPPATMNIEKAETVTQNIPAPADPPPEQATP